MSGGMTLVCTIGCFDLLHVGHLDFLREAAELGDTLIIGMPDDALFATLKGHAPVVKAAERAEMLMAMNYTQYVDVLSTLDYELWIDRIAPDILALGEDQVADRFVEAAATCELNGGRVVRIPRSPRNSTTAIIDRAVAIRAGKK